MKYALAAMLIVGIVGFGSATRTHQSSFVTQYKIAADSKIGKASCLVCHATAKGMGFNPYGKDVKAAMKAAGSRKLTPEILISVEQLDSTKSGKTNLVKIKLDQNPGVK